MPREPCPVCGHNYRGSLADHLDTPKNGVTRCAWNLNTYRIQRDVRALVDAGYVRAGSTAGRVLGRLANLDGYEHIVRDGPTGMPPNTSDVAHIGREHDPSCWWCLRWARVFAEVEAWPMSVRRQLVQEYNDDPGAFQYDVIQAAYKIGGNKAVGVLGPEVIPARCAHRRPWREVLEGCHQPAEWCLLRVKHEGAHVGVRGSIWTG